MKNLKYRPRNFEKTDNKKVEFIEICGNIYNIDKIISVIKDNYTSEKYPYKQTIYIQIKIQTGINETINITSEFYSKEKRDAEFKRIVDLLTNRKWG